MIYNAKKIFKEAVFMAMIKNYTSNTLLSGTSGDDSIRNGSVKRFFMFINFIACRTAESIF